MTEQGRTEMAEHQPEKDLGTRSVVDVNAEAEQPQATEDAQVAHPASSVGHDIDNAPVVQEMAQDTDSVAPHKETTEQAEGPTAETAQEAAAETQAEESFVTAHKETTEEAEGPRETAAEAGTAVQAAAEPVVEKSTSLFERVSEAASSVAERVSEAASSVAERVGDAVAPVTDKVGEFASATADKVGAAVSSAKESVSAAPEAVAETVAPVTDKVSEVASATADTVSDTVNSARESVSAAPEAVAEAVAPVTDKVSELTSTTAEKVSDVVASAQEGVSETADKVSDAVASAPESVSDAVAPVAEHADAAVAAVAAEASYDPEQAEDGRPRRVKDLAAGMELQGRITSIALYGVFVDIGVGRDGLVHISEMSETRIDSPSDVVKIGDIITVRVKSVDPDGRRISLTMRNKERSQEPRHRPRKKSEINREALAALRVGDNINGTITGVSNFGVFVDIGVGKDGLVHVSELAEGRVEKPEDVVAVGETHTFKILEVDADGARISLSLRRAQRTQRLQQLEKGQIVEGTISGIAPFGAFIDIGVGRDGLVHISELSDARVNKVEDAVKVGDKVMVRVLEVDPQNKRISLTLRLEDKPREQAPREERAPRPPRDDRGPRPPRSERHSQAPRETESYTSAPAEQEEAFSGDATIEDLLSKYGSNKRDRRRRDDDEEEDMEDRGMRRQRDAIRRTLQHMDDE